MSQPLKSCNRAAKVAWCTSEAAPSLLALGASTNSTGGPSLDLAVFDPSMPAHDMDVMASVPSTSKFTTIAWSNFGVEGPLRYGILSGGSQDGVVSLWNPYAIATSGGRDQGLIHSCQIHQGPVSCLEFNPLKGSILASCGVDSQVKVISIENPSKPEVFAPSNDVSKHAGSEVICCAWNRKVQHILASCSNTGSTIVWDLKLKKEVISFKDPASRQRISAIAWHPEVPTQLIVSYDDDRHPSLQMWDLRNWQFPFKESAGHTKGILDVSWNVADPNLLLSCGKDNKIICWCLANASLDTFCEIPCQQGNFEARWAPHRPGLLAASSLSGAVNIYSVQTQQTAGIKYCPKWYGKPGGVSFGFGAKMLSYGTKKVVSVEGVAPPAPSTWCHSLVVPNEPEIVPTADLFERWIADRKLREFCNDRTQHTGHGEQEALMWELMGTQFDGDQGRQRVPALLGFDGDQIEREAEGFLGRKPGTTLMGPAPEQSQNPNGVEQNRMVALQPVQQEAFDPFMAEDFFNNLAQTGEQKRLQEIEAEEKRQQAEALGLSMRTSYDAGSTDWSTGAEALIKKALLIGNLPAAVECCFKSGRMAEGLLLASGGGTELWTRARDEYLRIQNDTFLSAVGSIMTNDFDKLVAASNLNTWKETLAILATYSGDQYRSLCLQLAERLEKEKFDIRSAVVCYICAGNFQKTISIWSNTSVSSQVSKNIALQDLVEKMAVLQEATKFNETDALYNAKLTQYAEILANSGRLTAAMRFLCLLRDDTSSAMLRERIYNSAPVQMSQLFGRPPAFPFEQLDVRVAQVPQNPNIAHGTGMQQHTGGSISHPSTGTMSNHTAVVPKSVSMGGAPRPHMGNAAMPPSPNLPATSGFATNAGLPPQPHIGMHNAPGMGQAPHYGMVGNTTVTSEQPVGHPLHYHMAAPTAGPAVLPPGGSIASVPPRVSTAPQFSAMPVTADVPVPWPLPTKTQQKLSTTSSVAEANRAVQEMSAGGGCVGEPMATHDLQHVRSVLTMLLDASAQDGNTRKRDDIAKRLEELYTKLQMGHVRATVCQKLLQLVHAVEAQDFALATRLQQELCGIDWEANKGWLMGVKRLMAR